jgi:hypothetical protein
MLHLARLTPERESAQTRRLCKKAPFPRAIGAAQENEFALDKVTSTLSSIQRGTHL